MLLGFVAKEALQKFVRLQKMGTLDLTREAIHG